MEIDGFCARYLPNCHVYSSSTEVQLNKRYEGRYSNFTSMNVYNILEVSHKVLSG